MPALIHAALVVAEPEPAVAQPPGEFGQVGETERTWQAWLVERNRSSARIAFWLTITIYPAFGVLDWLTAPRDQLALLFATRVAVSAWSIFLILSLNTPRFVRHWQLMTSMHALMLGGGISVMVRAMGGLDTPYYAGLNLSMLGVGLLFVWPLRQAALTHGLLVLSYILPNAISATPDQWVNGGAANVFFVLSTATVVTTAQHFMFGNYRDQVARQVDLERTTANLAHAHSQLKALDAFKTRFFANITHELKTPLAMVLSPMELLLQGDLGATTEPQKATLRSMLKSGMKLLKLINDLLDLSRLEQARVKIAASEQDLIGYLRNLTRQAEVLAQRKGIQLDFEPQVETAMVFIDQERLERVFINLLSNALKFTPSGGHVWVRAGKGADHVWAKVVDNGPGFPSEEAERLFERFYQVDMEGTRQHGGAGIGLALARELTELHGGTISAQSAPGKGATFTITLRLGSDHFQPDQLVERPKSDAFERQGDILTQMVELGAREDYRLLDLTEATERRVVERDLDENEKRWTVLVVDDTLDVIRVVHLAMRQDFKVLAAPDGLKGLELAKSERPSLIITDLMMPGIDGYEMVRRLRADAITAHIPIIMLTARGALDDRVNGLESGVNAFMVKPFSPRELLTVARSLLSDKEAQADLLLTQRMDSLESIAGGIAHEINNPINYIRNAVQRISLDVDDVMQLVLQAQSRPLTPAEIIKLQTAEQRTKRMMATANAGVQRITGTVEVLGRYSREGFTRAVRDHDLFQGLRDIAAVVVPAIGRAVDVQFDMQGDGTLRCVPDEIHQAFSNLIQNGVEACPAEGGVVTVVARRTADRIVISVSDNGAGIADADRQRIFEPFFTTKGPGRGMGMGLTITRRVVQSAGGTISVERIPEGGTRFEVSLPAR